MLLEAVQPGAAVQPSEDEQADILQAGRLLRELHRLPVEEVEEVPDAVEGAKMALPASSRPSRQC